MPRDIPVGNGSMLVAFDKDYILREFYFPRVGEESHTNGERFRIGVWANNRFSWLPDGWTISLDYLDDTLATDVLLENKSLMARIQAHDLVDFQENIYLKKLTVTNLSTQAQEIRIFFCHDFHIYGNDIADTACFRPEVNGILHYKSQRYFLINVLANNRIGPDQFACGNKEYKSLEGTWKDAEDGILSANPIAQGAVDSALAIHLHLEPKASQTSYYWICAGRNWEEASRLNKIVASITPEEILRRTTNYWRLWVDKEKLNYDLIPRDLAWLYKRSLLILRTQIDNEGAIVAGNDSDVLAFNRDTYSYMWPRDGALTAYALDLAGYCGLSRSFFNLCAQLIDKEGYFLHKYNPKGTLASSWHAWLKNNKPQLPIQEDETALVIWALWNHYIISKDIEFIKPLYKPLIKNAADFMLFYRDRNSKLPLASFDLWEEKQGIFTFTASAVYAGLMAAGNFAQAFGDSDIAAQYKNAALEIRQGMDSYLYLGREKRFAKMINFREDGEVEVDPTVDASLYGIFAFGAYQADDEKVKNTMGQVYEKLWCRTNVGGLARYENDAYYRAGSKVSGNPWLVTTLWLAQYYIAAAKTRQELDKSLEIMRWALRHALASGVLAEQIDPDSGAPISVSPLTWSHATFIMVIQEYINKLLDIEKCTACNQSKYTKARKE